MDLLERIRRARAAARRQGAGAALARLDALEARRRRHPSASTGSRARRVPLARAGLPSWFAEDDEWELETTSMARPVGRTRGRLGAGPAPTVAELEAELLGNERNGRAHEDRIRRESTRATRRQVRQQTRTPASATELFARARRVMGNATRSAVRGVTSDPLLVRAAVERLAGREGHPGRYLRGHVPLEVEATIERTKRYLAEHLDTEASAPTAAPGNYLPHGAPHA